MPLTTAPVLEITTSTTLDAVLGYQLLFWLTKQLRSTTQNDKHYSTTITYAAETVSLFDEIILFVKGKVLYTGPIGW
jgi:hypothetical protein